MVASFVKFFKKENQEIKNKPIIKKLIIIENNLIVSKKNFFRISA